MSKTKGGLRTTLIDFGIESIDVEEPLIAEFVEGSDSTTNIIDSQTKEKYAWVTDNETLWLDNHELGGKEGIVPRYDLTTVSSIRLAHELFHVVVVTTDGKEHIHMRNLIRDPTAARARRAALNSNYDFAEARDDPSAIEGIFKTVHPEWEDTIWYDTVRMRVIINRKILSDDEPYKWMAITGPSDPIILALRAEMHTYVQEKVQQGFGGKPYTKTVVFKPYKEVFFDTIMSIGYSNPHDPFMETIRRTKWDGLPRLDTFLSNLGGKAHLPRDDWEKEYLAAVGRGIFLSAIQRHRTLERPQPIPFIPVFISDQYVGKTDLVYALGLNTYSGSTNKSLDDMEDLYYEAQGKTFIELRESSQFSTDSVETMKAFADASALQIRLKYDRMPTEGIPITFTTIATTNNGSILKDDSGNRRFFVVYFEPNFNPQCGEVNKRVSDYFIDPMDHGRGVTEEMYQLWAEALELYDDPESPQRWNTHLYDPNGPGLKRFYNLVQSTATTNAEWEQRLMQWLDQKYPKAGDLVESFTIKDFLAAKGQFYESGVGLDDKALSYAMKKLGMSVQKYDLRKVKDLNSQEHGHYRVYVRTADAIFTQDSDLENVADITSYSDEDPMDMHYS